MKQSQFVCECGFEEFWAKEVKYGVELECIRCGKIIQYKLPAFPKVNPPSIQTDYIIISAENLLKLMNK